MKCPYCGYLESKIIDSRFVEEGDSIAAAGNVASVIKGLQLTKGLKKYLLLLESAAVPGKSLIATSFLTA